MSISTTVSTSRPVLRNGLTAAAAALLVIEIYAAVARTAGVPLRAGFPGAHSAQPITAASVALGVVLSAFWGTILAHRVYRPQRTFATSALVFTAVSLNTPLDAAHAATSTRLTLVLGHLLSPGS